MNKEQDKSNFNGILAHGLLQFETHDEKMSPHLLIVAQKASELKVAIEQQSKIEGEYTTSTEDRGGMRNIHHQR